MAIIHCDFVPHQNKSIIQHRNSKRNNPADNSTTKSLQRVLCIINTTKIKHEN